jgi:integrase
LVEFFGGDRRLDSITAADAERWRIWLATEGNRRNKACKKMADNTVRRRTGRVRQFFTYAIKQGVISSNPFDGLPASVHGNTKRQQFVPSQTIETVLDTATCADLRAIIALSRYGGLRIPSEAVRLTWQDVDFEAGRLTINAKKTEHHKDGGVRFCPIFPELRPFLQELYDRAKPGIDCPMSTPVITRWRSSSQNIGTAVHKLLKAAGVKPWPRLFNNLRASRETELFAEYPLKDVCSWIGNSETVAMKHYAMPTTDSFQRAVCCSTGCSIPTDQQASSKNNPHRKPLEDAGSDSSRELQNPDKLAEAGLEPARSVRNSGF